jgi:hypothetical protein
MKVCCCTYYSPSYKALADIHLVNLSEYCQRHGYTMWVENIENDKWEYKKHEMFKELFEEGFDVIWYRDIDSVISNLTIPITMFLSEEGHFFLTMDYTELNGGSVVIRNTHEGRRFNELILSMRSRHQNEQNCYNILELDTDDYTMKTLPQQTLNSYLYELYPEIGKLSPREGQWEEGHFVLHVPALAMGKRIEVLKNAKITR